MPYYHVYIEHIDKGGREHSLLRYNYTKENVRELIAIPYMKNERFISLGVIVHPSSITRIVIFKSRENYTKIILPNKKSAINETNQKYIVWCFYNDKVKNVDVCTQEFITKLPEENEKPMKTPTRSLDKKKKIFIVHGRNVEQALLLQKYLDRKLKLDAIVFDDLPDKGKTIFEQLEYIRDNVSYAIAIVTPDDVGCLVDDMAQVEIVLTRGRKNLKVKELDEIFSLLTTRPRQNVIFELGLFIGALGRDKVCYLLQKDVQDELSDLHGILHKSFDKSVKEVFHEIASELKEG